MARKRTGTLVFQRGDWHGVFTVDTAEVDEHGRKVTARKWIPLHAQTRTLAARKLASVARELATGAWVATTPTTPTTKVVTVEEYALAWADKRKAQGKVSARDERTWLVRHILPHVGALPLADVRPAQLGAVLDAAIASKLSRESVRKVRAVMGRVFTAAWREELVYENPMARVEAPEVREVRKERVILTDAELGQLLTHPDVNAEIKMLALVARVVGGMRTGDLSRWDWAMIDRLHFAACVVPRAKTGTPQALEVPAPLRPFLRAWWTEHGEPATGPVFPVRKGPRKGTFKRSRGVTYAARLRRALWSAGVVRMPAVLDAEGNRQPHPADPLYNETAATLPVDFHSFRRAYNTALADAGVNVQTAMGLAGHSDAKTHMGYVMRAGRTLALPAAAMPAIPQFEAPQSLQGANDSNGAAHQTACFSVRPVRFERTTFGFEGRCGSTGEQNSALVSAHGVANEHSSYRGVTHESLRVNDSEVTVFGGMLVPACGAVPVRLAALAEATRAGLGLRGMFG